MNEQAEDLLAAIHDEIDWEKADKGAFVELLSATDENDRPMYFYFLVKPSRFAEYKYNVANFIPFDLNDFGTVLEEGTGFLPTEDQQRYMELLTGIKHADIAKADDLIAHVSQRLESELERLA